MIHTVVFFMLFLLVSCGGNIALKKSDLASIKSVSISKDVICPEDIFYFGQKEDWLGLCCGIGTVIGTYTSKKRGDEIKEVMEQENISIATIVREQFIDELETSNLFSSVVNKEGDAEFKLSILQMGFSYLGLFSGGEMKPVLHVEAQLVQYSGHVFWKKKEGGKIIWQIGKTVNSKNNPIINDPIVNVPSHSLNEYLNKPELIREAFALGSQIMTRRLIHDMKLNVRMEEIEQ